MNWNAFGGVIALVVCFAFVILCLVNTFIEDRPWYARALWFAIGLLFVATVVGVGSHYAQQQDKERQCRQYGGLYCNG